MSLGTIPIEFIVFIKILKFEFLSSIDFKKKNIFKIKYSNL